MMGDGVRPGKNSTCFTVLSLAVDIVIDEINKYNMEHFGVAIS